MPVAVPQPSTSGRSPVTTLVERLDLPAALPPARSRRDTETETVQFAQATLAAAKRDRLPAADHQSVVARAALLCGAARPVRADWLGSGQGWPARRVAAGTRAVV